MVSIDDIIGLASVSSQTKNEIHHILEFIADRAIAIPSISDESYRLLDRYYFQHGIRLESSTFPPEAHTFNFTTLKLQFQSSLTALGIIDQSILLEALDITDNKLLQQQVEHQHEIQPHLSLTEHFELLTHFSPEMTTIIGSALLQQPSNDKDNEHQEKDDE